MVRLAARKIIRFEQIVLVLRDPPVPEGDDLVGVRPLLVLGVVQPGGEKSYSVQGPLVYSVQCLLF